MRTPGPDLRKESTHHRLLTARTGQWFVGSAGLRTIASDNALEIGAIEADAGEYLGYVRVAGRRRPDARLLDLAISMPYPYAHHPHLRTSESPA